MQPIFGAAAVAITGVGLLTFDVSPTKAAVFSVGTPNGSVGNFVCMDVSGNALPTLPPEEPVPLIVYDCHAGPNQQFQWAGPDPDFVGTVPSGMTIYTEAGHGCVDVRFQGTAPGTLLQSIECKFTQPEIQAQQFYYKGGQIVFAKDPTKCLDATDMQNFTQIVINTCDPKSPSQQWQIK